MKFTVEELKALIGNRANEIALLLDKGKDVEIRSAKDGITIIEVTKKVVK